VSIGSETGRGVQRPPNKKLQLTIALPRSGGRLQLNFSR
jgi:hypothetical protein